MKILMVVLDIICISFCNYVYIKSFSLIFKSKIKKINLKDVIALLAITITTYYNTFYNYNFSKILISFISLFLIYKIIFKEAKKTTFFKLTNIYLLGFIVETFIGAMFVGIFMENLKQLDATYLKIPLSILIMLVLLLLSYIKSIRKALNKIYNYMEKTVTLTLIMILFIIVLVILTLKFMLSNNIISDLSILVLILIFLVFFILILIQIINIKKADEKQEILLNFMKKYETIIDEQRISKHEMLNNLLVLKSIKEKNTPDYEEVLDDIIACYKTTKTYSRLYELPSGLKGMLYYKIYDMQELNLNTFIDISNKVVDKIEQIDTKKLTKVCKIIGILLDNSKEAALTSKEKSVIIDIYGNDDDDVIIYIENSINRDLQKLNVNTIKEKGFSTKGPKRGYGLYLVEEIIKMNKDISLEQRIEDKRFVSVIRIKQKQG